MCETEPLTIRDTMARRLQYIESTMSCVRHDFKSADKLKYRKQLVSSLSMLERYARELKELVFVTIPRKGESWDKELP